jgi:hypothetical protein
VEDVSTGGAVLLDMFIPRLMIVNYSKIRNDIRAESVGGAGKASGRMEKTRMIQDSDEAETTCNATSVRFASHPTGTYPDTGKG